MDELVPQLNSLCEDQPFHTGWFLKDLHTGETAERCGHEVVPSASTRKIAILATAMKAVTEGKVSPDQLIPVVAENQNNTSGCFRYLRPGFSLPFRDHLIMMIIVSDNTCTGTVCDWVGGVEQVNAFCDAIGMSGTTHRLGNPQGQPERDHSLDVVNTTTPADVGRLLDLLLQGMEDSAAAAYLGSTPELCRLAIDILSWQKFNDKLPFLLPEGTRVAHKTGTGARNHNDAGIIYHGDEPSFILTVYTEHVPVELADGTSGAYAAKNLIARLCRTTYDALSH